MTTATDLARALIDDDQGVCFEGHDCELVSTPRGTFERVCYLAHATDGGAIYSGQPLIAWGVTLEQITEAEAAGVDKNLTDWAFSSVADRAPEVATYDGNTRINIVVDGLDIDLIRRETGELFVSFAAVTRDKQAVVGETFIDAYTERHPHLTVHLADRSIHSR